MVVSCWAIGGVLAESATCSCDDHFPLVEGRELQEHVFTPGTATGSQFAQRGPGGQCDGSDPVGVGIDRSGRRCRGDAHVGHDQGVVQAFQLGGRTIDAFLSKN